MAELFVRMRNDEINGEGEIPVGAVDAYKARGWTALSGPRSWSQAQDEETIAAMRAAAGIHQKAANDLVAASVAEVLASVGDDPAKARAALDAERAGKNRKTLVAELDAIANPDEAAAGGTENEE